MSKDVQCPYCGHEQDINHDDGYGYEQDRKHEQDCRSCEKTFIYTTMISFDYEVEKADCLNGSEHNWTPTKTYPRECTLMICSICDTERPPTNMEKTIHNIPDFKKC